MLKKAGVFFSVALVLACAGCITIGNNSAGARSEQTETRYVETSMQEQHNSGHWISGPYNGRFIVIGVSGRLTKPDEEIEAAKQDAARKISMYHGIQGSLELSNTAGSGGFFDYSAEAKLDLRYDTNYGQYVERLSFDAEKDVIRGTGAVFIRFQYSGGSDINYSPAKSKGRPSWVNLRDLPEFNGFTTVVGHAGKRSRLRDTISASCDSAAGELIRSASTQVTSSESSVAGVGSATTMYTHSEGSLMNFQVLEIWIDPKTEAVHTLAIARVSK